MLSSIKENLVGEATKENEKVFLLPPTLIKLCCLLRILIKELVSYRVWPENCWFFCSLLQQHLGGAYRLGGPTRAPSAPQIRSRILCGIRDREDSKSFIDIKYCDNGINFDYDTIDTNLFDTLSLCPGGSKGPSFLHSQFTELLYEGPSRELVLQLQVLANGPPNEYPFNAQYDKIVATIEAASALAPSIVVMKSVSRELRQRATEFLQLLHHILDCFIEGSAWYSAQSVLAICVDAIRLCRALAKQVPLEDQEQLALWLDNLSSVLVCLQKMDLAQRAAEQACQIWQECYRLHPAHTCHVLICQVDRYCSRLGEEEWHDRTPGNVEESCTTSPVPLGGCPSHLFACPVPVRVCGRLIRGINASQYGEAF
ncbi:hypothetical protein DL93DRAFT_1163578 [Clavulina sp. PMI_390]|nr:hypothetical protein DL93DRAFT_1163578 [Clavulina sp. PMI_390]